MRRRGRPALSSDCLIGAYKENVDKKRSLVSHFISAVPKTLFADENLVTLVGMEASSALHGTWQTDFGYGT